MIDLIITSFEEAEELFASSQFKHIISIGNPRTGAPNERGLPRGLEHQEGRVLRIECYDQDFPTHRTIGGQKVLTPPPSKEIVQGVVDFAQEMDGKCLIHCDRGISRSSAAAYISLYISLKDEQEALKHTYLARAEHTRALLMPNAIMVQHADEILRSNLMSTMLYNNPFEITTINDLEEAIENKQ